MNTPDFSELINRCLAVPDGEPLTPPDTDALRRLCASMPWMCVPALMLLRHGGVPSEEAEALRKRLAVICPDSRTLAFAAHGDEWKHFYPESEEPAPQETNNVIDTFLRTYGTCTPEEEALLERMIFNPTPDYAEMLAREEQDNLPDAEDADPQQQRINAFILSQHPATHRPDLMSVPEEAPEEEPKKPVAPSEPADDSLLSESLAKIFIKRGSYERAYEIISGLNLKFPKKSAYFADQLRFLQKLIINQRLLQQNEGPQMPENK